MELILASTSPYRRQLLERLGLPFRCVAPGVDEEAVRQPAWIPEEVALHLARLKAEAVASRLPDAFVIGSDQVAECAGQVLGKPGHRMGAMAQLSLLAGKPHYLWTAVAFATAGEVSVQLNCTRLTMRSLTATEIERYLDADQPWDCAGSYKLESRGIALFESIETDDSTAIIGLPLIAVTTALRGHGFTVP
ncbi:MAG TPA: Maf family protein [Planctomycetaceae bacterium]|nr:Maf family protein [Planctomycetaceae bacterium]